MEQRTQHTVNAPDIDTKLLRLPKSLHQWFKVQAKKNRRSVNAEILVALELYQKQIEIYTR